MLTASVIVSSLSLLVNSSIWWLELYERARDETHQIIVSVIFGLLDVSVVVFAIWLIRQIELGK